MKSLAKLTECIALSILSLSALSCNSEKKAANNIIDIAAALNKARIVDLSEIAEDITYIPLETTDSSLVGNLYGMIYILTQENNHIYTFDDKRVVKIFDLKGKYINSVNRKGRGPEEYSFIQRAYIEPITGNIIVFDSSFDLYEYTPSGKFIRKTSPPALYRDNYKIERVYKIGDNRYVCVVSDKIEMQNTSNTTKKDLAASAIIYDSLSNIVAKIPRPNIKLENIASSRVYINSNGSIAQMIDDKNRNLDTRIYSYKDSIRLVFVNPGYIYSMNKDYTIDSLYKINLGEYKITAANIETLNDPQSKIISFLVTEMESDNCLFLWLNLRNLNNDPLIIDNATKNSSQNKLAYGIYDKRSGKVTIMYKPVKEMMGFNEDLQGGPPFWPKSISHDGKTMIGFVNALDLIMYAEEHDCSKKIKELASKLSENDNPVAVIVKLKK